MEIISTVLSCMHTLDIGARTKELSRAGREREAEGHWQRVGLNDNSMCMREERLFSILFFTCRKVSRSADHLNNYQFYILLHNCHHHLLSFGWRSPFYYAICVGLARPCLWIYSTLQSTFRTMEVLLVLCLSYHIPMLILIWKQKMNARPMDSIICTILTRHHSQCIALHSGERRTGRRSQSFK